MKLLDKRYKRTKEYLENKEGKPVYKRRAFSFIDKVLGPQYKWINKTPEEYFKYDEAKLACRIFKFKGDESFSIIKSRYQKLSKGDWRENKRGWHPDMGGHPSAFAILNHAYNIFKEAFDEET